MRLEQCLNQSMAADFIADKTDIIVIRVSLRDYTLEWAG